MTRTTALRFSCEVQEHEIPNTDDLSDEQIASMWYSRDEMSTIRAQARETKDLMMRVGHLLMEHDQDKTRRCRNSNNDNNDDDDDDEDEDIEQEVTSNWLRDKFDARIVRRTILDALYAVLDEQDLQREEGIQDEELLADVYFAASRQSQWVAREKGLRDELETKIFSMSPSKQWSELSHSIPPFSGRRLHQSIRVAVRQRARAA
jgi:hypothetical protein